MSEALLFEQLTAREYEVLNLIAAGRSNQEIANQLVVARSTAKWHVRQLYNKMGVENRRQAITRARAAGLLSDGATSIPAQPRHNLPAQVTPFIGRQAELAELDHLLADAEHRLITILGPGGMGKTRLALAAAEQQVPHFADGVAFVPLAPLTDPTNLVATIAEYNGFQFLSSQRELKHQLLDFFRKKHLLLVLDNFEHLLDGASLVTDILQAAPGVKVLVTSRELLGLYGETTYNLSGMPLTRRDDDAVRLFIASACRTQRNFRRDDRNMPHVIRICQLVGGLPLGIELAAAWLRTLTLKDIATELGQGLNLLETRTHSLHTVFDRSWRLMTEKQQQAFMRLSAFRGGCTRVAAEAVTGVNLRVLQNLVDKSLVWHTADGRFEMHELLRQYAAEKLETSGEGDNIRDAHMNYFANLLHQRNAGLRGPGEREALDDIERDFDNVRAAWNWAALRRDANAINRMVGPISHFGSARGLAQVVNDLFQFTAEQLAADTDKPQRACLGRVLCARAGSLSDLSQYTQAEDLLRQSLEIAREFGDKTDIARCLCDLVRAVRELEQAKRYAEESVALFAELDDKFGQAHTYFFISEVVSDHGKLEEAYEYCLQCIALCRDLGNKSLLAFALGTVGNCYYEWGRTEEAQQTRYESLLLFRELNNRYGLGYELTNAAGYATDRGDLDEGERLIRESLMINREIDEPERLCYALSRAGVLAEIRGDDAEAIRLAQESLIRAERSATVKEVWETAQLFLAWALCIQNDFMGAAWALVEALEGLQISGQKTLFVWCLPSAVWVLAARGQPVRAIELLGLAVHTRPGEIQRWNMRPHWRSLLDDLEAELGSDVYQAAFERGKGLDFDATAAELIADLAGVDGRRMSLV